VSSSDEGLARLLAAVSEIPRRMAALEQQAREINEALRAMLPSTLYTVPEAARLFKVGVPTMRRWVRTGQVPSLKIGNVVRVDLTGLKPLGSPQVGPQNGP
jgi:excisionase family DNA binding protein